MPMLAVRKISSPWTWNGLPVRRASSRGAISFKCASSRSSRSKPVISTANSSPASRPACAFSRELGEHAAREDLEARVAGRVAERVVDVFEPVDVEIEHRDVLLACGARARSPAAADAETASGSRSSSASRCARGSECAARRACARRCCAPRRPCSEPSSPSRTLATVYETLTVVPSGRSTVPSRGRDATPSARRRSFDRISSSASLPISVGFVLLEQLDGGGVGSFDLAVGVRDQQRLAHARQQAVEIVARDRARAQVRAHRVDGGRELAQLGRIAESGRVELAVRAVLQRGGHGAQRRGEAIDDRGVSARVPRAVRRPRHASAAHAKAASGQRPRREQVGQSSQRRRDGPREQQDRSHETALERRIQKRREHSRGGLDSFYYLVIVIR